MSRDDKRNGSAVAKATDAAVRRALVESRQDLLAFLRRRLRGREEAQEVLQRFSLRALERAADLRDVRTVRGWLGRILASTIVDHQRHAIRRRQREVAWNRPISRALRSSRMSNSMAQSATVSTSCCQRSNRIMRTSSGAPTSLASRGTG